MDTAWLRAVLRYSRAALRLSKVASIEGAITLHHSPGAAWCHSPGGASRKTLDKPPIRRVSDPLLNAGDRPAPLSLERFDQMPDLVEVCRRGASFLPDQPMEAHAHHVAADLLH